MDLQEIKEYLATKLDELEVLELLDLSIDEIVDKFEDRILERQDYIERQLALRYGYEPLDFSDDSSRSNADNLSADE